ncbi:unnamed protein product [Euphydryas editha]|uniref:Uncharacterized protein n=1 Tax=Euphydryas editha TaxID=104508 RepID=A0AAU9UR28_EUPED|nr:unnamed protein product [Euphydryas editha]
MEPEFVNESMWDEDDDGTNNDETNFGEDDSNMEMTGFDGSTTGDGNITGGGEGGAVGDAQDYYPVFSTTRYGNPLLLIDCYRFNKRSDSKGPKVSWVYGRAGSLAVTPGEKLMELLRPSVGTPRRHSTAACAPAQPRPSGFVYCPSDALPYCPPSRFAPPRPVNKLPPPQIQQPPQPPPVPQRTAPVVAPLPVPPPAPPRRSSPQPPRRVPPPTPPRPVPAPTVTIQPTVTDPNGNKRPTPIPPQPLPAQPRLDCNRNPQPPVPRRPPQKMPDNPYTPAPLPQNNQVKRSPSAGSNISVRQDSNVSSDSFSQTSSPSYTTKTMEAPLLPHQHVNKSLNAKIARGLLLKEQQEKEAGNSSITKSMSTPASLQTIVRFQNGSNMSLHHRVNLGLGVEIYNRKTDTGKTA